jgi:5-methylcytosine-specific restriction endonuclease McrA
LEHTPRAFAPHDESMPRKRATPRMIALANASSTSQALMPAIAQLCVDTRLENARAMDGPMQERGFWTLCDVSDDELLGGLWNLLKLGARNEACIVAHLAEVDARRLTLLGGSSLFDYCVRRLGLSEHEAYLRIAAARAARKFPLIFELLEHGQIHLSAIALLGRHLTLANHVDVLTEARGKTKRALLKMMARRWPKADFSSYVRRLPVPSEGVAAGPTGSFQYLNELTFRLELCLSTEQQRKLELARDLLSHANPSGNLSLVVERALDLLIAQQQSRKFGVTKRSRRIEKNVDASLETPLAQVGSVTPGVDAASAGAKTDAGTPGVGAAPSGKKVGAATHGARLARAVDESASSDSVQTKSSMGHVGDEHSKTSLRRGHRAHIPNEIRRQLLERDGFCCSYTSPAGERCQCRQFLQIHHEKAWSKGGPDSLENLRLVCAQHNQMLGELEFGQRHERVPAQSCRAAVPAKRTRSLDARRTPGPLPGSERRRDA